MPRKPSPKNLDNPLRILRVLCSEHGETAPLTQVRMAQITGIAPDYIRSLENSRRPINPSQLDKIRYSIGAVWDRKRKMWMVNGLPDEPFSYEWFLRYRTLWRGSQYQADIETHMLCRRVQALLLGVESSDYNLVFDRIFHALEEIRTELKVGAAKSVFEKTEFEIKYTRRLNMTRQTAQIRGFSDAEFEASQQASEITSIHREFNRADKEIYRSDLQIGVGEQGWLDFVPYSSSVTRYGNVPEPIDILVVPDGASGIKVKEAKVRKPERFNKLAERLRAEKLKTEKGDA
jgi:hypothetical protein